MTLIIAGYEKQSESSNETTFFISDSAITRRSIVNGQTTGVKTLLTDYRKLYTKEIIIHYPKFNNEGVFERYYEKQTIGKVVIAFAGGKDTAHHIINEIEIGLSNIKVSFESDFEVRLVANSAQNSFEVKRKYENCWDLDRYHLDNIDRTLSHEFLASLIKGSIEKALISARKFKLSKDDFQELKCQFITSLYCRVRRKHFLYKFNIDEIMIDHILMPNVTMTIVPGNTIAFIGAKNYGQRLIATYQNYLISPDRIRKNENRYSTDILGSIYGVEYHSSYNFLLPKFIDIVRECQLAENPIIDFPVHSMTMDDTNVTFYNHKNND